MPELFALVVDERGEPASPVMLTADTAEIAWEHLERQLPADRKVGMMVPLSLIGDVYIGPGKSLKDFADQYVSESYGAAPGPRP
jgi:hypothetical protein